MARSNRLFAGQTLRALRRDHRMDQAAMAATLGISVSYLSQLETEDRPITAKVKAALATAFPLDWSAFDARQDEQMLGAFAWALTQPDVPSPPPDPERMEKLHLQYPEFAARYVDLHRAYRAAQDRVSMMEEAIASDMGAAARMPWERIRDWFHDAGNYIHALDTHAETLAETFTETPAMAGGNSDAAFVDRLADQHGINTHFAELRDGSFRRFERARGVLTINAALPEASRRFRLAHQLMRMEADTLITAIANGAAFNQPEATRLLRIGLANYAAGALLMPYEQFRRTARDLRHDIDPLARAFGVSFEQACHRLSTLQRPGSRGIPFFFCRVDMAGNITKRHSATRLQFARFGGACPLWVVHEAVAIPDRVVVQLGETPDGVRYVSMAKGLVKPSGSFARAPRRFAVALGCEVGHAGNFVYADGLRLSDEAAATPIGVTCRLCPRAGCDQRAFPPIDRPIHVDPDQRLVVPYEIG